MAANSPTVLLVEDDEVSAYAVGRYLEDKGYRVITESRAMSALDQWQCNRVDIVIADVRLAPSGPDGILLAHMFKSERAAIPIIFVTAYPEVVHGKGRLPGPVFYKPVDLPELHLAVEEVVAEKPFLSDHGSLGDDRPESENHLLAEQAILDFLDRGGRISKLREFLGYIGSAIHATDRKGTKDSTLAHVQRLAIMGELTGAVAHELRQPSASILSNAEAALALLDSGQAPSDEIREIVSDIKRANLRANEVLGLIQDFVRKRETEMQALELNGVVSDVLLMLAGDARKRRVQIHTELGEGLPLVFGNRTQLQQVLINLIVNGMDATSNTPVEKRQLVIRTTRPDGDERGEVTVTDSGSGIAPEHLPHLFESFFTTRAEGMGLGLSIARSIVESHGGRIWADNNPGGGATFHFTVQIAQQRMNVR
jgi:signal transduction histidine kinase